jgi:hypothetical protein
MLHFDAARTDAGTSGATTRVGMRAKSFACTTTTNGLAVLLDAVR